MQFWESVLSEDFMHRAAVNEPDEYILNQVLLDLKDQVDRHGFTLNEHFGLPEPDPLHDHNHTARIIQHEIDHSMEELQANITYTENRLNNEQQTAIKKVMESVEKGLGKMTDALVQVVGQEKRSYYDTSSKKSVQKAKWLLQQLQVASQLHYCQKAPPFTAVQNVLSFSLMNPLAV